MTPDELRAFEQRTEKYEPPLAAAFLAWVQAALARLSLDAVVGAIRNGVAWALADALWQAGPLALDVLPVAVAEAELATEEAVAAVSRPEMRLRFDMKDPFFERAVEQEGARAIREVEQETRDAVNMIVARARRSGWHPYQFAPQIRETVGLTARQSNAVMSFYAAQLEDGADPARAAERADRYSGRLLTQRAKTIARTETLRGANVGRRAAFRQAADAGLFNRTTAELEWIAGPGACEEICVPLDGTRVPLDQGFDEGPPGHPNCRCTTWLVLG